MWAIMSPTRGAFLICMENVWEWTADWYSTYPAGNPVIDPTGEASGLVSGPAGWFLGQRRDGPAFC